MVIVSVKEEAKNIRKKDVPDLWAGETVATWVAPRAVPSADWAATSVASRAGCSVVAMAPSWAAQSAAAWAGAWVAPWVAVWVDWWADASAARTAARSASVMVGCSVAQRGGPLVGQWVVLRADPSAARLAVATVGNSVAW